jgi:hypothetical protein
MSDPDWLTPHDDKSFGPDTRGLVLRIIVVALLGVLLAGDHRCRKVVTGRNSKFD